MKRIRVHELGGPEVLRLEEVSELTAGPGQVLVRVMAAGVNPVDTYVRAGLYGYTPKLPYTPGSDAAGVVEAMGDGVRHVAKGDRVYGGRSVSGAYAEQALFDAAHVHPLPDAVTFAQGACLGIPYVTAYAALFLSAKAQPRQTLLVHGASGGVGTAAVQLARQAQVTVIGTAGSEAGRRLVKEQGADVVLDHRDPGHLEELLRVTKGRGVDMILEMLANENLGHDLKLLAPEGRVVVIGCRGTVEIDPRELMVRDAAILGIRLKNLPQEHARQIHAHLGEGLRAGALRPVVGKELPLSEAAEAHRAVMRPPAYGNIVLMV